MNLRKKLFLFLLFAFFITFFISFKSISFAQTEEPKWERMGLEGWESAGNSGVAINPLDPRIIYAIARTDNPDPNSIYPIIFDL